MSSGDRWLLRLAATVPLWLLRYVIVRQQGQAWLAATIIVDIALMISSWRAVSSSAAKWPGRGDPASVESFVYLPAALAAVLLFFDVVTFIRQAG